MTPETFRLFAALFIAAAFVMWTVALFMISGTLGSILWALKDSNHHWQAWHRYEVTESERAKTKRGGA